MKKIADSIKAAATAHNIHPVEALDEVFDAIAMLGIEPVNHEDVTNAEAESIAAYLAKEYATNRTRL